MMQLLAGNVAHLSFRAGAVSPENASVVRFHGREGISELYRFSIELVSTEFDLNLEGMVGQDGLLTVIGGPGQRRHFHGIIASIEMQGRGDTWIAYRVELVPRVWLLTQQIRSRIFQEATVAQILGEVLNKGGVPPKDVKLPRAYEKRQYCVQYNESDFDFISRLMEEEGLFYFFEHGANGHRMIIADSLSAHPRIEGALDFKDTFSGVDEEYVYRLSMTERIQPGRVTLRDFNFIKPGVPLEARDRSERHGNLEVYLYPGEYVEDGVELEGSSIAEAEGARKKRYAEVRLQEYEAKRRRCFGRSSCRRFGAGSIFELKGHPRSDANGEFLLVAVEHRGSQKDALAGMGPGGGGEAELAYENGFECQPARLVFRPAAVTPRPRVLGSQTAVVTGPPGEEIHTDAQGRVKVKFHWDREGAGDARSSCWVRVSQTWAGLGWGGMFIPRIGQEVIVEHIEGDPDRPIITGRVYNGRNTPPYPLPAEKTKSTIKSESSIGGAGQFNEIRFEDVKGGEEIYVHGQKDLNGTILNNQSYSIGSNESHSVGNGQSVSVGGSRSLGVGKDESITIGNNQTKQVGVNESTTVGANRDITVGAGESKQVGATQSISVGAARSVNVGGSASMAVAASETRTVGIMQNVMVGGAQTLTVGGAQAFTVGGAQSLTVGGIQTITVGGAQIESIGMTKTVNVGDKIEIVCGAGKIVIESSGKISIEGTEIAIAAKGGVKVTGTVIELN